MGVQCYLPHPTVQPRGSGLHQGEKEKVMGAHRLAPVEVETSEGL